MKKTLRIVAFLLAMLMMLAVFAGCNKNKKEKDNEDVENASAAAFRNALAGFVTDLGEMPILKTWMNVAQHGSMEIQANVNVGELAASMGETGVRGHINAGGKFYYSPTGTFVENLNMDIYSPDDNIGVTVGGDIFLGTEYIYVKNDNILGGAIGLVAGETAKAFENCTWKDQIPTEAFDVILQFLKIYDGDMNDVAEETIAEITPVIERYVEVIFDALEKNAKFTDTVKKVSVGGEDVESRVVTLIIDEESIVGFIKDVYAAVKDDAELRALIVKYGDMLKDYTGGTGEELAQEYDRMLAELGSELDSLEEDIPQGAIMASVVTPADASTLRKLEISMRDGDESAEVVTLCTLDIGKGGLKDTDCITLNIMDETVVSYKIDQNDENGYKAALEVTMTGRSGVELPEKPNNGGSIHTKYDTEASITYSYAATSSYAETVTLEKDAEPEKRTMTCFTLDINKKAGTYAFSIPEVSFAMGGTFRVEGDKTTIVFNSLTVDGETYNKGFSLTLVIDENDEIPNIVGKNDVTNIFDLTEKDFEEIVDRFESVLGDLIDKIGPKDETPVEPGYGTDIKIPAGYQSYNNGDISFAYPEGWYEQEQGAVTLLVNPTGAGNNISIAREARTDYYENLTPEIFKKDIQPQLEAAGYKASEADVDYYGGPNGEKITAVYYSLSLGNVTLDQLMLAVNSGEYSYVVCVTTVDGNYDIENTVADTLASLKH